MTEKKEVTLKEWEAASLDQRMAWAIAGVLLDDDGCEELWRRGRQRPWEGK